MNDVLEFVNRYLDEEFEAHKLDCVATDSDPVYAALAKMEEKYFAKHGILPLHEYLHAGNPPTVQEQKTRRAEIQRRPLFKIARYGKGKSELYRAYMGSCMKSEEESYYQTLFARKQPKLRIVAVYQLAPGLWSSGHLDWEVMGGEKFVVKKLGRPIEVMRLEPPAEKTSLGDYNADE